MEQIKLREEKKKAIDELSKIIPVFRAYSLCEMGDGEFVDIISECKGKYPLPSGRWGNILALALEMNYYIVAKSILYYKIFFDIDLDAMAADYDGNNVVDLEQVIKESSLTKNIHEEAKILYDKKEYIKIKKFILRNEMSFGILWKEYVNKKSEKVL